MSWQEYIDVSLVGTHHIDKAAIISAAGDSVWAASPGFTISPDEMKALVPVIGGDDDKINKAYGEGIYVAGERYVVFRVVEGVRPGHRSVYARMGKKGLVLANTTKAVLVAHYGEDQVAQNATKVTEDLAEYLTKLGS